MKNQPQPTPLERLRTEKQQIKEACQKQEEKLNKTFTFLQANPGHLLLSGFSSMLFPSKPKSKYTATETEQKATTPSMTLQMRDYLSLGKALMPVAWEIIQPLLISFGIKLVQKRITNLFKPKAKEKNDKAE